MDNETSVPSLWKLWRPLALPSLFFLAVIYCEELFLKVYCFRTLLPEGAVFTFLFTLPPALLLGVLCGGLPAHWGRILLPALTALVSVWVGTQMVYYHMFKTFLSIFSLTKMAMVAQSFGEMAVGNVLANWFPILMLAAPTILALIFRKRLIPAGAGSGRSRCLRWAAMAACCAAAGCSPCGTSITAPPPRNWRFRILAYSPRLSWS